MKLGTLLLRDGVINLDQLEAALRHQVLFGGMTPPSSAIRISSSIPVGCIAKAQA